MISGNLTHLTKVCKDYTKVENYYEAVKSDKMYVLHHCAEFRYTSEELKAMGKYYDRPPHELIFIPASLHASCVELHIGHVKPKAKQLSAGAAAEIDRLNNIRNGEIDYDKMSEQELQYLIYKLKQIAEIKLSRDGEITISEIGDIYFDKYFVDYNHKKITFHKRKGLHSYYRVPEFTLKIKPVDCRKGIFNRKEFEEAMKNKIRSLECLS